MGTSSAKRTVILTLSGMALVAAPVTLAAESAITTAQQAVSTVTNTVAMPLASDLASLWSMHLSR